MELRGEQSYRSKLVHHSTLRNLHKRCKQEWLLKSSFDGFSAQNLVCKLLNPCLHDD